jgi:3-hydroxyisobutyrate dehydrogenase-like beta-hydroxyacid dehydrogenase
MEITTKDTIGIVGVGAMGLPIVRHLTEAGFTVVAYDLSADARAAAVAQGGVAAERIEELATCRVLLVFVPTDEDAVTVARRWARVAQPGSTFVIHSSVKTKTCIDLTSELGERGIKVVDAALTGGVRGARDGEINLLVGGTREDVDELAPVFAPWTSHVNYLGKSGNGQIGKSVNNMIHWGQIVCIVEALSLGQELGLSPDVMRPALENGPTDSRTLRELEEMKFTWYEKDTDNAVAVAAEVGRTLHFAEIVRQVMRSINVENVAALLDGKSVVELPHIVATPAA